MIKESGYIYLGVNNDTRGGIYSWLQRVVTGKKATHSYPILEDYYGDLQMLNSREVCTLEPLQRLFNNPSQEYLVIRVKLPEPHLSWVTENILYNKYINVEYGYAQILFFVFRCMMSWFGIDAKGWKNWFPNAVICSETVFSALIELALYRPEILPFIKDYNSNSFHSGDAKEVYYQLIDAGIAEKVIEHKLQRD